MIQSMPIYIACLPNYWNENNENAPQNNIVYNVIIYMTFVKSYHKERWENIMWYGDI